MEFFSNSRPKLLSNKNKFKLLDNISDTVYNETFYSKYIAHNLFVIILLSILVLVLLYKYYTKKETFRPAFNPTLPISEQQSFVDYLPEKVPVYKNQKLVIPQKPKKMPKLVLPDIPIPTITRNDYTGQTNTYKGAPDHLLEHPYDWPNNFNSSTSSSIAYMVDHNKSSFSELDNIIADDNYNLINNLT